MKSQKIFFIFSVNPKIGYGHYFRCLGLAKEFLQRKYTSIFILCNSSKIKRQRNIRHYYINNSDLRNEVSQIIRSPDFQNSICVVDRKYQNFDYLKILKQNSFFLIDINGEYKGKNPADLIVRGDIGQKSSFKKLGGVKYKLLGGEFDPTKGKVYKKKTIILSFGSSDPSRLSEVIVHNIANSPKYNFKLIIGQGFKKKKILKKAKIEVILGENNLGKFFPHAHAAIISAGITLYEALLCKTPCLVIPQDKKQEKEVLNLESMGLIKLISKKRMIQDIKYFIKDDVFLSHLRQKTQKLNFDLKAPERIVNKIETLIY
jgi:spore coat polysaccharide biosynthesis predicted glycosyltransferase SpsG